MSVEGKRKGHFASDVHIKSNPGSSFIVQGNINKCRDSGISTQIEIKEEPFYSEITFPEMKSEPVDVDLYSDTKEDVKGDKELLLDESQRLDAKTPWDYGFDVINTDTQNGCLKPNVCHEIGSTNAVHEFKNLSLHNLIHESKQQFNCDRCDKSLATASSLKIHNLTHDGKRPFKCKVCFKSFTRSEHLKRHNLIHEGKRPFICYLCDKSFTRSEHLKRHNLIHEGKKLFKCDICYKGFTRSEHLKAHHAIHNATKPFNYDSYDEFITLEDFKKYIT